MPASQFAHPPSPAPPPARIAAPPPLADAGGGLHGAVVLLGLGFVLAMAAGSFYDPRLLPAFLALGMMLCLAVPVIRWPVATSAAWVLLAATSPEMWLGDILVGQATLITAVVKLLGLVLVGVCMVRYGARMDLFNPAFAFLAMFVVGFAHGLYPGMTAMDSVRSLIGGAAPFAFSFSRLSRRWCNAVIEASIWSPAAILLFGTLLAVPHIRPLFMELGGTRLAGSTHPAFLGGFCATAIYAALVEIYRTGRQRHVASIALNYVILVLSGARAPLGVALLATFVTFFFLRSESFPARRKLPLVLAGMALLPIVVAVGSGSDAIRLFSMFASKDEGDLSGRNIIWPFFQHAWAASPTFGWGVGASRMVMDPDLLIVKLLGTTAAHNEYLRIGVDGGYVGLFLLITLLALWTYTSTRRARRTDRIIMRVVLLAFAIHSFTDNTLIAATASVMFTWVSAVFARSALEAQAGAAARRRVAGSAPGAADEAAQIA